MVTSSKIVTKFMDGEYPKKWDREVKAENKLLPGDTQYNELPQRPLRSYQCGGQDSENKQRNLNIERFPLTVQS